MKTFTRALVVCGLVISFLPLQGFSQSTKARDGQRDFDFHIGTWKTHLKRRLRPLTGSNSWVEYEGTTLVRKVWNGRANLVELEAEGSAAVESQLLQQRGRYYERATNWRV